jgi:ubiquinone/menaquinone biosynthesis C-methylase UbiE
VRPVAKMENFWARYIGPSGQPGPDYWNYFAKRLTDLATIPEGAAVLDVGTCDGNVLFKAMKKVGARGCGIGIDIDGSDLKEGIAGARERRLGNVAFAQMDAAFVGFPSESFDSVVANFVGWDYCFDFDRMEFIAPDSRMAEINRVLKPGGQVGIGFWIEQRDIDWMVEALKRYLPKGEEAIGERMLSYGKENSQGYAAILRSSGFHQVRIHVETTAFVSPDTSTWWRQMQRAVSDYFEKLPELEQLKEQILAGLAPFQSAEGIQFDKTVAYAFGTRL